MILYEYSWGIIILLVLFLICYDKLRKKEIGKLLSKYIILSLIFYVIGGFLLFLYIFLFHSAWDMVNVYPVFVLIGITIINKKFNPYLSLQNSKHLTYLEKTQQKLPQNNLYGQNSENNFTPSQE